jgi:hypothetical protein
MSQTLAFKESKDCGDKFSILFYGRKNIQREGEGREEWIKEQQNRPWKVGDHN